MILFHEQQQFYDLLKKQQIQHFITVITGYLIRNIHTKLGCSEILNSVTLFKDLKLSESIRNFIRVYIYLKGIMVQPTQKI